MEFEREGLFSIRAQRAVVWLDPRVDTGLLKIVDAVQGKDRVLPLWQQRDFWNAHIGPWARHFFSDLEGAKNSLFYAPVGAIGRAFMEIEKDAFKMAGDSAA